MRLWKYLIDKKVVINSNDNEKMQNVEKISGNDIWVVYSLYKKNS